ncbi:MAG: hypothetical protein RL129_503 [Actinomycetota bacterium]|jgi:NAD(P)-dependent dehydrogenase (short-subunit alcohol dehydrogenase family)
MSKVAIVTGGAKGIGFGSATQLLEAGFSVALFDIDVQGLANAIKELSKYGDRVKNYEVDIAKENAVKSAIDQVAKDFGRVDAVANCAGIQTYGTALETTEELWDRTYNVNVKSMLWTSKYAIPYMRKNGSGSIVNISSVQSLMNQKGVVAYASSKGAINSLTRAIAIDHAEEGIRCNAILPASVDTPMIRASARAFAGDKTEDEIIKEWGKSHPVKRMASIYEIGNLVTFLCSDASSFITGSCYNIDGGLTSQVPVVLPE